MEKRGDRELDRRTYLVVMGGTAAGLPGRTRTEPERRRARREGDDGWPTVTSPRIGGWREAERVERAFERSVTVLEVSGEAQTRIYEERNVRRRVNEQTGGGFDRALVTFFATRIDLRGFLARGVSAGLIAEQIEPEFLARLEGRGVHSIEEVTPRDPRPEIPVRGVRFFEYRGVYPVADDAAGIVDTEATMPIAGIFAVWKTDATTAFAAGGAYPAANEVGTSAAGREGDSDVLGLRFDPERLRRRIVDLTESVE